MNVMIYKYTCTYKCKWKVYKYVVNKWIFVKSSLQKNIKKSRRKHVSKFFCKQNLSIIKKDYKKKNKIKY